MKPDDIIDTTQAKLAINIDLAVIIMEKPCILSMWISRQHVKKWYGKRHL